MLASAHRLKNGRDIARVMMRGQYSGSGEVVVRVLRSRQPTSRAVIVVSKKIAKRAVIRNRIRRRLAALLATHFATVAPGYDIVVTVRSDTTSLTPAALERQLTAALSRAGLTKL
jgi:ribonuclease P protein component